VLLDRVSTRFREDVGYLYNDHADDVIGLINALKLPAPILLGHSMGGMTAAVVASRKPNILRGVILADPSFLSPQVQQEVYNSDVAEQHRKMLDLSLDAVIADAQNRHPKRSNEINELFARARLQTSIAAFDVLMPPNPDYKMLVSEIDAPCLIVYGDNCIITPDVAEELQRLNSKLQAKQIPYAGHTVHLDQQKHFLEIVNSFIRSMGTVIDS
jgi:pimeloyl-ACP methyl ester carboxylesterase